MEPLKVRVAVTQAKFKMGYRYLDRCGEAICQITEGSKWTVNQVNPQSGSLINHESKLLLTLDSNALSVSRLDDSESLSQESAEVMVRRIAIEMDSIYPMICELFKIPETIRFGMRFSFTRKMKSQEDCESLLVKSTAPKIAVESSSQWKTELCGIETRIRLREDSGILQQVRVRSAVLTMPGQTPFQGFLDEPQDAFLDIDIDTYLRPEEKHVSKVEGLIRTRYSKALGQAEFLWRKFVHT